MKSAVALCAACVVTGIGIAAAIGNRAPLAAGLPTGVYLLFSIKVADRWERVAVLRLGRYSGLRGPGLFHVIPVIDTLTRYVDRRIRVAGSLTARLRSERVGHGRKPMPKSGGRG